MSTGLETLVDAIESGPVRPKETIWTIQSLLADMRLRGSDPAVIALHAGVVRISSFEEIADKAWRLAAGLFEAGVRECEPVLVFGPNSADWIIVRLAIGASGALCVALDDLATKEDVQAVLADSDFQKVFCASKHLTCLQESSTNTQIEFFLLDPENHSSESPPAWTALMGEGAEEIPSLGAQAPAMLLFTSGTTGAAKRFTLSYANVAANVLALVSEDLVRAGDRLLLPLPLHHAYPQIVGLFTTFASGAAVVLPESVTGPKILEALRVAEATGVIGVPRLYAAFASSIMSRIESQGWLSSRCIRLLLATSIYLRRRYDLEIGSWLFRSLRRELSPSLRLLVSGGARLDPTVLWTLSGLGWDLRSGYGLAETASIFTGNLPGRERLGSEGKPFSGGKLRIADADVSGVGEIQLFGPSLFAAYLDDPDATRAAFTRDGWFRTGDLGFLDRDGFLTVTGRKKELIVLGGGKKVNPEELEKVYSASPYVAEIGILEENGRLVALVRADLESIRAAGFTRVEDVLRVSLKETGAQRPAYQRLAGFVVVTQPLPRSRLGKIKRFLLPDLYHRPHAEPRSPVSWKKSGQDWELLESKHMQMVWRLIADRYATDRLTLDADLELDLGIDSLEWVVLSLELERRFGIVLDDVEMRAVTTLRDLLHHTERRLSAARPSKAGSLTGDDLFDERWLRPTPTSVRAGTVFLYWLNRLLVRTFFRLEARGIEELPGEGAFIIASNHCSDLDPMIIAAALPWKFACRIYWSGDAGRLFGRKLFYPFFRAAHVFPVDGRRPARSLSQACEVLKRGQILVWFPEEWRSPTGALQPFQPGVGWIIAEASRPVVPAILKGTFEAMPRYRKLPRFRKVSLRFGKLMGASDLLGKPCDPVDPQQIANRLHEAFARQAGEDHEPFDAIGP